MKTIPVGSRRGIVAHAVVDDGDYEQLVVYHWHFDKDGYVRRAVPGGAVYMHRQIMDAPAGLEVDHIDRDRLNHRRSNLRLATRLQNGQNVGVVGAVPHRGVTFNKRDGKWTARAKIAGKSHRLGDFDTPELAAAAAAEFRREHMPYAEATS